jgi:hypothetical protein
MSPKPLAFKLAALSFSVLLAGSYVWYRSGGSLPFVSSPVSAETPEGPDPENSTPKDEDRIEVPPDILAQIEAQEAQRTLDEIERDILLSGSKSEPVFVPRKTAPPKPEAPIEKATLGAHFPGSKSEKINLAPPIAPAPQSTAPVAPPKRTVLPGSKSAMVIEREPAPARQQQRRQEAPVEPHKRAILPGPKSWEVDVSTPQSTSQPPVAPKPQEKPVAPVNPKRTILPGSKSMRINIEPKAPVAPTSVGGAQ